MLGVLAVQYRIRRGQKEANSEVRIREAWDCQLFTANPLTQPPLAVSCRLSAVVCRQPRAVSDGRGDAVRAALNFCPVSGIPLADEHDLRPASCLAGSDVDEVHSWREPSSGLDRQPEGSVCSQV